MTMKRLPIPPVTLGIDMLSDETGLLKGAVREATNVDLGRTGGVDRRHGFGVLFAAMGAHSLWASPTGRGLFFSHNVMLNRFEPPGTSIQLFGLRSDDPVDFCEHNNDIFFTNRTTIGWIPKASMAARALGVPSPESAPTLTPGNVGGLRSGKYTVCLTVVDDRSEESGASDYVFTQLTAPGGIMMTDLPWVPAGWSLRAYMSPPNGTELYYVASIPAGMPQYLLGDYKLLKPLETADLQPLPPGDIIRALAGRVYTARGRVVSFSETFRFGLTSPAHGHVTMDGPVTIVEPVSGGCFIGAGEAVWFLNGDPSKADLRKVSNVGAVHRSSALLPGTAFNSKTVQANDQPVAVWLSAEGYVAGLPDGSVTNLQADRIRVDRLTSGRTTFVLRDGRKQVVTPVTAQAAAYGTASDSV